MLKVKVKHHDFRKRDGRKSYPLSRPVIRQPNTVNEQKQQTAQPVSDTKTAAAAAPTSAPNSFFNSGKLIPFSFLVEANITLFSTLYYTPRVVVDTGDELKNFHPTIC